MPLLRRLLRWALLAAAGLAVACVIALGTVYYLIAPELPDVETLHDVEMQEPMYVYASDGRLMAVFGEIRRYPVEIAAVPERLKQAFIAIEDNRFYEHRGVDYVGVGRAVWLLLTTDDERVPGGSTITQQVARQFFLSTEYSYTRKFAEMMLAWRMERELSKDEIFELYLNRSFFGNRAYGVTAAAEFYYGKDLAELSLDEIASLAGIPKFPSSGNPVSNPERARIRRDYILQRMAELGFITDAEKSAAQRAPMHATPHEPPIQLYAPYVAEMVRQEMIDRFGAEAMTKGYHVVTTIDAEMQRAANQAVRDGLVTYDSRHGWHGVEQQFELAEGEDAETAKARLRGIATQTDMLPALVLETGDGTATVVLRSGRVLTLGRDQGWNGRNPASLVKRGDVVRVHRIDDEAEADDGSAAAEEGTPRYALTQLPRAQAALVSMEADTGALRALTGGFSFAGSKFNRATQATRQPGSSFKPFLYAASFERGFNPASIVLDAPVVFRDRAGNTWRPQNDDARFLGPMRLREALVRSRNLVSVRLLDAIGVDYARKYISHFGFEEDRLPPNLSMSLGTASLTPLSIARGYAAFANGGFRVTPWLIKQVKDRDGAVILGWTGDNGDPDNFLNTLLGCSSAAGNGSNIAKWCYKPFDDLVVKAGDKVLFESDSVIALRDIAPQAPVHLLVVPKTGSGLFRRFAAMKFWIGDGQTRQGQILSPDGRTVIEGRHTGPATAPDPSSNLKPTADAVIVLGQSQYHLVILDLKLPDMDGLELLQMLGREGIATPVIILSAKGDEIDRVVGLKVGADDYVAKPFSRPELLARIEAVLVLEPADGHISGYVGRGNS